jgi:predicted alpha/beta hydrolase family esterase
MHKKQIIFIHGGTAFTKYEAFLDYLSTKPIDDPLGEKEEKRWQGTLKTLLADTHEVYMPSMPNKQNAKYEEWKIWFERYHEFLLDGVILMGHSQGGYFLAKYLSEEKMPVSVGALFLLAAPFKNDDFGGEDGGDFAFDPQNLSNLTAQVNNVHILHSEDDPIVPYAHALLYKDALPHAILHTFNDKNHFILEEFPELIEEIGKI